MVDAVNLGDATVTSNTWRAQGEHHEACKWPFVSMWEFHCFWRLLVSTGDQCCIYMLHLWASSLKEQSAVITAASSADLLIKQQQMSWHWQACTHLRMFSSSFQMIAVIQLSLYEHCSTCYTEECPDFVAAKSYQKREGKLIICTDVWFKSNVALCCAGGVQQEEGSKE